jgi:hypothetical protein
LEVLVILTFWNVCLWTDDSILYFIQIDTDLFSCVWASWAAWTDTCTAQKEVGRRLRTRNCQDLAFGRLSYENPDDKSEIAVNRQIHLCTVNDRDLATSLKFLTEKFFLRIQFLSQILRRRNNLTNILFCHKNFKRKRYWQHFI